MTSENFEFSDISDQKYNSETKLTMDGRKNGSGGCFLSATTAVILAVLAVALAVGVGIIVYFAADGKDIVCKCDNGSDGSSLGASAIKDKCVDLAENGDTDVCNKCPSDTKATTPTPTATGAPTTKPPKVLDVRLPKSVIPIHYDIKLQPYMYKGDDKDFTFKGECSIIVRCEEDTNNITVHIKVIKIDKASLKFTGMEPSSADPVLLDSEEDKEREFFIFRLSKNMRAGKEYMVSMNYTSPLTASLKGLYLSSYQRNNQSVYLATTQFQPTDARRAFPCFDEPAIKATFNVTLVRKKELISIANTPIIDNSTSWEEDGITYVADVYMKTPKMSTYLLAFVVCDFAYTSDTASNGIVYRAFSRPEVKDSTQYALDVGVSVLPYFENYFNTTYPLPKQDMIAIPDFAAGAMENWGLITYRETAMLYQEGISNEDNKERVAIVVSHELAHQWFGDLVTPSWWDDLWLNEGFATFVEYMGVDHVQPEWKMFEKFVVSDVQDVFDFDALITSHPVYVPVNHPDEINEIFDSISYSKGGSIIRMMRHFLGLDTFKLGLVRYLHKKAFQAAFHDDLWESLEEQATAEGKNIKVKEIMDTWTLQMNYPVVLVTRDFHDQNSVHVMQSRYLVDPTAKDPGTYHSEFGYKWTIPITLTSSKNPNFSQDDSNVHWMYKNETSKYLNVGKDNLPSNTDPNGWIIANIEQNGFYRVNYQKGNWKALIRQLDTAHEVISVINRAQIINDAWNLAKPGMLDIEIALDTVKYLNKEFNYVPWTAARKELYYVDRMISLSSTYGSFQTFMKQKAQAPYAHYGWNSVNPSHIETLSRNILISLACGYGITNCTDEAIKQYKMWMDDENNNGIDPNVKFTVYCTSIKQGDWAEWNFALRMYLKSNVASERDVLMRAMTCTRKPWILNHYLNLIIQANSPIRKQDALDVIGNIGSSTIGQPLAWQFYRQNFNKLSDYFSASFFSWSRLIGTLTRSFNTEFQLSEIKSFMEANEALLGTAKRAFEQAMEKIRSNINWMDKYYPIVDKWFSDPKNLS